VIIDILTMERRQNKRSNAKRASDDVSGEIPAEKRSKLAHSKNVHISSSHASVNVQGNTCDSTVGGGSIFSGLIIFILETRIGKTRRYLFGKQVKKNGGELVEKYTTSSTHIVVDEKMEFDRMCKILKVDDLPESVIIVKSTWISSCLKVKKLLSVEGHELKRRTPPKNVTSSSSDGAGAKPMDSSKDRIPFKFSTGFGVKECKSEETEKELKLAGVESTFDEFLQSPDLICENTDDGTSDDEADEKPVLPELGVVCSRQKREKPRSSDADSDYVPSGDEGEALGASGSDATPSSSPLKNFPVSIE
jgi:hypothetical protein